MLDFNTFYWYIPFILFNSNIYITFHGFEKNPIPKHYIILRKIAEIFTKANICVGKFIIKYYHTKPNYITYGGINTGQLDKNNINKKYNINSALFIGRLESDTGILEYIKALKILKRQYNINLHLEICGNGKLKTFIEKYSRKYDLSVKINGFIEDLEKYYDESEIVLCSSYLTILESLFKKRIVISLYQNKLKEDYLKLSPFARYILIAKDPDEIAQIIKNYLLSNKNNEELKSKIIKGHKFSLNNDWNKVVKIYLKLWKS